METEEFMSILLLIIILRHQPLSMPSLATLVLLTSTPSIPPMTSALSFVNSDEKDIFSARRAAEKSREMCNMHVHHRAVSCTARYASHAPRAPVPKVTAST